MHNARCYGLAILGELDQAQPDCTSALQQKSDRADFLDSRGYLHQRMRMLDVTIGD